MREARAHGFVEAAWLREAGYEVRAVSTGGDCVDTLAAGASADVVLLDEALDAMPTADVLEAIHRAQPAVPVILVASAPSDTGIGASAAAAYDRLTGPVDRIRLLTSVRNGVERHRMSLRLAQLEGAAASGLDLAPLSWRPPLVSLDELERLAIESALRHTNGNVSAVVRLLGIGRTTLYRKLKKYGLQ